MMAHIASRNWTRVFGRGIGNLRQKWRTMPTISELRQLYKRFSISGAINGIGSGKIAVESGFHLFLMMVGFGWTSDPCPRKNNVCRLFIAVRKDATSTSSSYERTE